MSALLFLYQLMSAVLWLLWTEGFLLFLLAADSLEDVDHPVEERGVHLETEIIILVLSTPVLVIIKASISCLVSVSM